MEIIYENNNYIVEIGKSAILEDCDVYVARNKRTNIAEAEEQMLPKIVDYAIQLNDKLEEMEEEIELFPDTSVSH